jgi:hypothetical protein
MGLIDEDQQPSTLPIQPRRHNPGGPAPCRRDSVQPHALPSGRVVFVLVPTLAAGHAGPMLASRLRPRRWRAPHPLPPAPLPVRRGHALPGVDFLRNLMH